MISAVFAFIFKKMADESVPPKVDFEKLQTVSRSQFKAKSREGFNGKLQRFSLYFGVLP